MWSGFSVRYTSACLIWVKGNSVALIASASSSSSIKTRVPVQLIRHLGIHPHLHGGTLEGGQPALETARTAAFEKGQAEMRRGGDDGVRSPLGSHKCAKTAGFNNRADRLFINCGGVLLDFWKHYLWFEYRQISRLADIFPQSGEGPWWIQWNIREGWKQTFVWTTTFAWTRGQNNERSTKPKRIPASLLHVQPKNELELHSTDWINGQS